MPSQSSHTDKMVIYARLTTGNYNQFLREIAHTYPFRSLRRSSAPWLGAHHTATTPQNALNSNGNSEKNTHTKRRKKSSTNKRIEMHFDGEFLPFLRQNIIEA